MSLPGVDARLISRWCQGWCACKIFEMIWAKKSAGYQIWDMRYTRIAPAKMSSEQSKSREVSRTGFRQIDLQDVSCVQPASDVQVKMQFPIKRERLGKDKKC